MIAKKWITGMGLCAILASHVLFAAMDSTVTYKNQRGSTMVLTWNAETKTTGTLTGKFTTAVGNCKEDMNVPLPLSGYFNGNVISMTVNFPHCKQVVAMTGSVNSDQTSIHTLWLDANQANDPEGKNWNANIIGSDVYQKIG